MVESALYSHSGLRRDLEIIAELVKPGGRVLDLGCGDGSFLKSIRDRFNTEVLGLEIDPAEVAACVANGVPVVQGDLDDGLDFAGEGEFDLVVLSLTLQQMRHPEVLLERMVRAGKIAAVSFINFGHHHCRLQLLFRGMMPRTTQIPYHWYDTPNIHLGTILDFRELCRERNIRIIKEIPVGKNAGRLSRIWPNWFAPGAVFVLEKAE